MGELSTDGVHFLDSRRFDGTLPQQLEEALSFISLNMKHGIAIDALTGQRTDRTDYPIVAIREALLNALVHRDYSAYTEAMPIQVLMFQDRMEICSPGGLYGRLTVDQLWRVQPDTRNPLMATALELLGYTENRYSGVPTIRQELAEAGMRPPEFVVERGTFVVRFWQNLEAKISTTVSDEEAQILAYCQTPRSRHEVASFLGLKSANYAIKTRILPLIEQGLLTMAVPGVPASPHQKFVTVLQDKSIEP